MLHWSYYWQFRLYGSPAPLMFIYHRRHLKVNSQLSLKRQPWQESIWVELLPSLSSKQPLSTNQMSTTLQISDAFNIVVIKKVNRRTTYNANRFSEIDRKPENFTDRMKKILLTLAVQAFFVPFERNSSLPKSSIFDVFPWNSIFSPLN